MKSPLACLLAVAVLMSSSTGCTSFSVEHARPEKGSSARPASLRVSVYQDRDAMKRAEAFGGPVRSKLTRVQPPSEESPFESAEASWLIADLAPGRYKLEVSRRAGPEAESEVVWHGAESFSVKAGEEVSAVVIVKDSRAYAWGGAGLAIAAAAVVGALLVVGMLSWGHQGITVSRNPASDSDFQHDPPVERRVSPIPAADRVIPE